MRQYHFFFFVINSFLFHGFIRSYCTICSYIIVLLQNYEENIKKKKNYKFNHQFIIYKYVTKCLSKNHGVKSKLITMTFFT